MSNSYPSVLPVGWVERYTENADLEASFLELEDCPHFHAATMRGRIRTLQSRFGEAWEHFDRAEEQTQDSESTIPNLVRMFLLEVYRFEAALIEAPLDDSLEFGQLQLPWVSDDTLRDYPEVRTVLNLRRRSEAVLRLHTGHVDRAIEICEDLLEESDRKSTSTFFETYLALAAAYFAREEHDKVAVHLENASLAALTTEQTINQAVAGSRLSAFHGYLEDRSKSAEWKEFLLALPCPRATKDSFLALGVRMQDRCSELGRLVVL